MSSFLEHLDANFGTKSFSVEQKISAEIMIKIKQAIQTTPTSFGLQPFLIVDIQDSELRKDLRAVARDQAQMTDASHLLLFCARTDIHIRIDEFVQEALADRPEDEHSLLLYAAKVRAVTGEYDETKRRTWATDQAYIALGFALAACAELGIDTCPIEGFNSGKTAELLSLSPTQIPAFFLALGYRKENSPYKRLRFSEQDLFTSR